jgi:hypothetical protein
VRRLWDKNNKEKIKGYHLKHNVGITLKEYKELLQKQKNKCSLCNKPFSEKQIRTRPVVDHCHISYKVRGILHQGCNSMIGFAKDKINLLQQGINYLNKNR